MKLTPIAVRGKRRRAGDPAPVRTAKKSRMAKQAGKTPSNDLAKNRKRNRRTKVSYLEEHLPLEVLKLIFMYSGNINFVRASPLIGKFLSEIETRHEVFVDAFALTWCAPVEAGAVGLERDANPVFQSALLEFSWANMRFIAECFEQCARRYPEYMNDTKYTVAGGDGSASEMTSAEGYFLREYTRFRHQDPLGRTLVPSGISLVHVNTRIPDALVTGPWDDESLPKLYWLICARAATGDDNGSGNGNGGYQEDQTWELPYKGVETAFALSATRPEIAVPALALLKHTIPWLEWPRDKEGEVQDMIRRVMEREEVNRHHHHRHHVEA